ncbi:Nif11-like leader peptide family natural product precursor [Sphaerothrix gracilis]|uniref:Nif11-like leader peptide family natural product precursor n=1 Tax=Sphaerothrix gracilis TaxID=3151835 RepID=UPI0031FD5546
MSKESVFNFFQRAAQNEQVKDKLQNVKNPTELVELGNQEGFEFSTDHVDEALRELKEQPGFFKALAEAFIEIFSPARDNYPASGVQPFSGEIGHRSHR